jgi:peptidoglycan/LPS O-acetylase OafA/YrhL
MVQILPSPLHPLFGQDIIQKHERKETAFLDGMRGIAALSVFFYHFALPYYQSSMHYGYGFHDERSLLQLPIVRLLYSGIPMVYIFFVISGFSLSIKPLEHSRGGYLSRGDLLTVLASLTFRRAVRLFLPPCISTLFVMFGVRLELFDDFHGKTPEKVSSFWLQFLDWAKFYFFELANPWTWQVQMNKLTYGAHLWTLSMEFRASLTLVLLVVGISGVYLLPLSIVFTAYCIAYDRIDIALFVGGLVCAQSWNGFNRRKRSPWWIALYLISLVLGLILGSMPRKGANQTLPYSIFFWIWPHNIIWQSLAAFLIVWSVSHMRLLQYPFETCLAQYMGKISFSLYIVHEPLLRAFGWALVPQIWKMTGKESLTKAAVGYLLALLLVLAIIIWISDIFWRIVDRPSMRFARFLEEKLVAP